MIHTIEIKYRFDKYNDYIQVKEQIKKYINFCDPSKKLHKSRASTAGHKIFESFAFSNIGINCIKLAVNKNNRTDYFMMLDIDCYRFMGDYDNYLALARENDYEKLMTAIADFIKRLQNYLGVTSLLSLKDWEVERIDYTKNIVTEYAKEYISLFKRGFIPYGYELLEYDSSLLYIGKRRSFNFYDKALELMKKGVACDNVLRLEVQCKRRYLREILKQKSVDAISIMQLKYLWSEDLCEQIIKSAVQETIGTGNFYKLSAMEKFGESIWHNMEKVTILLNGFRHMTINRQEVFDTRGKLQYILRGQDGKDFREKVFVKMIDCSYGGNAINKNFYRNFKQKLRGMGVSIFVLPEEWPVKRLQNPLMLMQG